MSAKKARQIDVLLTDRALSDLRNIEPYSIENWGRKTADKYLPVLTVNHGRMDSA